MNKDRHNELLGKSLSYHENNDCAVIALATVADIPYEDAHAALELAGRKNRKGTTLGEIREALGVLDINFLPLKEAYIRKPNKNSKWGFNRYTYKTIKKRFPTGRWLVANRNHIVGMVNGEIHDWASERKHPIINVWKILN